MAAARLSSTIKAVSASSSSSDIDGLAASSARKSSRCSRRVSGPDTKSWSGRGEHAWDGGKQQEENRKCEKKNTCCTAAYPTHATHLRARLGFPRRPLARRNTAWCKLFLAPARRIVPIGLPAVWPGIALGAVIRAAVVRFDWRKRIKRRRWVSVVREAAGGGPSAAPLARSECISTRIRTCTSQPSLSAACQRRPACRVRRWTLFPTTTTCGGAIIRCCVV